MANGGRVITGARVTRIVTDGAGLAAGAEWLDRQGHAHFQRADVVVCAANAIGTARLLLASAADGHPDGLANSSGLSVAVDVARAGTVTGCSPINSRAVRRIGGCPVSEFGLVCRSFRPRRSVGAGSAGGR